MEKRAKSLTARASWLMLAKTVGYAIAVTLPLLVVRLLSVYDYGVYKQAFLVIASATQLLPLGVTMSAYYFLPREPERAGSTVLNTLLYCMAVGGVTWLVLTLYPSLLTRLLGDPSLAPLAPWIGLTIALSILGSYLEIVSVAHQDTRLSTIFIVGSAVSRTFFLLIMLLIFGTIQSLLWGAVLHGLLQSAVLLGYLESRFPGFWREFDAKLMRAQLSYALPLGFSGVLYIMQTDLHNYVVSHQLGTIVFAVYAIGCFDLPLAGIIAESVNSVLIPAVSVYEKQNEPRRIIELVAEALRKLSAVFMPLTALMLVVAHEFIVFLFTDRYAGAVPIFRINLILLPLSALPLDALMRAYANLRFRVVQIRIAMFVALCIAVWFATARFGALGSITAVASITALEQFILSVFLAKAVGISRKDAYLLKDVGKMAIAAAVAAGITWVARRYMLAWKPFFILACCGLLYAAVYAAGVVMLRVVRPGEWDMLRRRFGRLRQYAS